MCVSGGALGICAGVLGVGDRNELAGGDIMQWVVVLLVEMHIEKTTTME
jgi:hypothetical protein